jgi:hypothetical protein
MSTQSYGSQMQAIRADEAIRRDYIDAATAKISDRMPYRDEGDDTDDRAWDDLTRALGRRGLKLHDDGSGYVIASVAAYRD